MRNNDIDLDRNLADVMAPLEASSVLRERLSRIPQMHPQRRPGLFARLRPAPMAFDGLQQGWASLRTGFGLGMTTSLTAAMASLVLGVFLGAGSMQGAVSVSATGAAEVQSTQQATATDESDPVAMVYAAADMPGELQ